MTKVMGILIALAVTFSLVPYDADAQTRVETNPLGKIGLLNEGFEIDWSAEDPQRFDLVFTGDLYHVQPTKISVDLMTQWRIDMGSSGQWRKAAMDMRRDYMESRVDVYIHKIRQRIAIMRTSGSEKLTPAEAAGRLDPEMKLSLAVWTSTTNLDPVLDPSHAVVRFDLYPAKYWLIKAAAMGDLEAVKGFLDKNVDPNAADRLNVTALMAAAAEGRTDVVRLLLDRKAKVNTKSKAFPFVEAATGSTIPGGWTALMAAASSGKPELVNLLLEHGAQVEGEKDDRWGALDLASFYGHPGALQALLSRKASPDKMTEGGYSALALACINGNRAVAEMLNAKGAPFFVPWDAH